jgi:hypothetical protein
VKLKKLEFREQVTTPNSVAASEAMPRNTFILRHAIRKVNLAHVFANLQADSHRGDKVYKATILPSIQEESIQFLHLLTKIQSETF